MSNGTQIRLGEVEPPTRRAAYSDRTAWLMAEMSRLAYLKFELQEPDLKALAEEIVGIGDTESIEKRLKALLENRWNSERKKELEDKLGEIGFELIRPFDRNGTQAFLARKSNVVVLAFRGTEVTQMADIKADLNAVITDDKGQSIHTGFLNAFGEICFEVKEALDTLDDEAIVYVTGHSLGGALAMVATYKLADERTAACYTFGSPRVGGTEFAETVKTPVYRVVNAADVVPRLPPGLLVELLVDVLRLAAPLLPFLESVAKWLDDRVSGYRHFGDMRFLTACPGGDYSQVRLLHNISPLDRLRRNIKNNFSFNRLVADHSIDRYCDKLEAWVNKPKERTHRGC